MLGWTKVSGQIYGAHTIKRWVKVCRNKLDGLISPEAAVTM
jgi:hypothetical protein